MKVTAGNLTILALAMLAFNQVNAQKASYTANGGMTIGFGIGGSYQSSDIANSRGAGFDFWLGHHIYKKENAFLAVDWKFRFLAGENRAYDHRENSDGTYSNLRYSFYNYDLELGLTLNRLRERTRIVITGFAGAGITHGLTFTDLQDIDANPYDYTVIDPNQSRSKVYADLLNLSDKEYETPLSNKAAIMPTTGIYIGYQFSRSFSMGIEHKINFSLNENNSTFGIDIDNNIVTGSGIDMNHYTTLGFRWSMGGRSSRNANRTNLTGTSTTPATKRPITRPITRPVGVPVTVPVGVPPTRVTPPVVAPPVRVAPQAIRFINPPSPVTVEHNVFPLKVQTTNLRAWDDVRVSVNGVGTTNFSFSPEGVVTTNIGLQEGQNSVEVSGKNESGVTTEKTTITYNRPVKSSLPVVTILLPTATPYNSYESSEEIRARVTGVKSQDNISVTVNGINTSNFTYDNRTFVLNTKIGLNEGRNVVTIGAQNEAGRDAKSQVIIKETRPCPPPALKMIEPAQPVITTGKQNLTFRTEVKNIADRNQLILTLNGKSITNFNYSGNLVQFTAPLSAGINTFVLAAKNDCGSESVSASITYAPTVVTEKPCGPRINPGNADWQFCLVTPGGTFNRAGLTNDNFSYTGPASSLYMMPIAGGGDAVVNGKPYSMRPGQYYLFTGNLTVTVSTKNPGSMGHWSVCISTDKEPVSGSGNNRPVSPCEKAEDGVGPVIPEGQVGK